MLLRCATVLNKKDKKYVQCILSLSFLLVPSWVFAQESLVPSEWQGPGTDWFTAANWTAGVPTDIANFATATPTAVSIDGAAASIDEIIFNVAGAAYTLAIGSTGSLTLNGAGLTNSSLVTQTLTVASGGTLTFNGSGGSTGSAINISNAGSIAVTGSGALANTSISNNVGGTFDISGSTGATLANITGAGNINLGSQTLTLNAASGILSGTISGAGTFALALGNTGTLSLTSANNISGAVSISAGTLALTGNGTIGTATLTLAGTGTFNIAGSFSSVNVGSLASAVSTTTVELGINTLTIGALGTTTTYAGVISGSGNIVKIGAGTLTLSGTNTYSGITGISTGTLALDGSGSISNSVLSINGGTFNIAGITAATTVAGLSGSSGTVNLGDGKQLIVNTSVSTIYSGNITGTGNGQFIKSGTGTLTITGNIGHAGNTNVSGGTLALSGAGTMGSSTLVMTSTGTFDISQINAGSLTLAGGLTGAGSVQSTIALGTKTLIIDTSTMGSSYSGKFTGTGGLTVTGTDAESFNGANSSYTGLLTVTGTSIVSINDGGRFGTPVVVTASAGFNVTGAGSAIEPGRTINNAGTMTAQTGGSLNQTNIINTGVFSVLTNASVANAIITNTGTITFNAGNATGSFISNTGAGAVTFSSSTANSTTIANSATLDFTGTTTASSMLLTNNSGGNVLFEDSSSSNSANISNAGTLEYTDTSTATSAVISNTGALSFADTSTAANAAISSSGTFTISGTTTGLTIGSLSGSGSTVLGSKLLTLGSLNTDTTYSGVISGASGTLTKTGSGTFTLNGINTYSGLTTVAGGTLIVGDASHASAVVAGNLTVNAGSMLGGHGTVSGNVINNGRIVPGNLSTASTFTVSGSYTQASSGILGINFAANDEANLFAVGGNATLNNGTLVVNTFGQPGLLNRTFTIMTIAGTRFGEFSSVAVSPWFVSPITYTDHAVLFTYAYNNNAIALVPQTPNQQAISTYILATGATGAVNLAIERMPNEAALQNLFDQLSGSSYATQELGLSQIARSFEDQLAERIDAEQACADSSRRLAARQKKRSFICNDKLLWFELHGGNQNIGGSENASGLNGTVYGVGIGYDLPVGDFFALGAGVGYTTFDNVAKGNENASLSGDIYQFGLYTRYEYQQVHIGLAADYGTANHITADRAIYNGIGYSNIEGDYEANVYALQGRISYKMLWQNNILVQPFGGLIYQQVRNQAFSEYTQTGFELAVSNATYVSYRTQLGVAGQANVGYKNITTFVSLAWEHELRDTYGTFSGALVDAPFSSQFIIEGAAIGANTAVVKAGVMLMKREHFDMSLAYEGRFASHFNENLGIFQVSYF